MGQWIWLAEETAIAIDGEQLAEHGGAPGLRDSSLLQTALAKPRQLDAYADPPPDAAALAASYAHGIARLHPFVDGNKRTALVLAETFLNLHGFWLDASDAECVVTFLAFAAGELDEAALAAWLRARLRSA